MNSLDAAEKLVEALGSNEAVIDVVIWVGCDHYVVDCEFNQGGEVTIHEGTACWSLTGRLTDGEFIVAVRERLGLDAPPRTLQEEVARRINRHAYLYDGNLLYPKDDDR